MNENLRLKTISFAVVTSLICSIGPAFASPKPSTSRMPDVNSGVAQTSDRLSVTFPPTNHFVQDFSIIPSTELDGFISLFPPCQNVQSGNCIESLEFRQKESQTWTPAKLFTEFLAKDRGTLSAVRSSNTGKYWYYGNQSASENKFELNFGGASIWNIPEFPHEGGTQYKVSVSYSTMATGSNSDPNIFNFDIEPIQTFTPDNPATCTESAFLGSLDLARLQKCGDGLVRIPPVPQWFNFVKHDFPSNIELRLKVKPGNTQRKMSTWFNGRIGSPMIEVKLNEIVLAGAPLKVPISQTASLACSSLTMEIKREVFASLADPNICSTGKFGWNWFSETSGYRAMSVFRSFEPFVKELGKISLWSIGSTNVSNRCKQESFAGVVTSDAQVYESEIPNFNDQTKVLEYSIASPHLDSVGNANRGNFHLALSHALAKCLWGEGSPISLEYVNVQIIYQDGEKSVGTLHLRNSQDWIFLDIDNFGFSAPKIQINLLRGSQLSAPTVTPIPGGIKKNVKITCIKGKIRKTVSGASPKCPTGFKRLKN